MDPEVSGDDPSPIPGGGWKLIRQIIGKLKDWAALSVIALYLLAVPASFALKNAYLAFGAALAFSVILVGLRAFQMSMETRSMTRRIDADRDLKLQKARNDFELKLARLNKPNSASQPSVPSIGASLKTGKANTAPKHPATGAQPKTAGGS